MTDVAYYRREAERCRKLAAASPDSAAARRWLQLTDEYAVLAEEMEAATAGRVSILRTAMQRQPMQQQARTELTRSQPR
jgi:hypothetical protein